jgi:hypothetical protein
MKTKTKVFILGSIVGMSAILSLTTANLHKHLNKQTDSMSKDFESWGEELL